MASADPSHEHGEAWPRTPCSSQFPPAQKPVALASYVTLADSARDSRLNPAAHPEIRMRRFQHKAHRDLPPTTMWGYNGIWPGPTFEVRSGQPLAVKWIEPTSHQTFPAHRHTIHGSEEGVPEVRTVTHVHGAQVLPESDGYPDAWVTSDGKTGIVAAANPTPLSQRADCDHALVSRPRSRHHSAKCLCRIGRLLFHSRRRRRCAQSSQRTL